MKQDDFNHKLLSFLSQSPTPFHAVQQMSHLLDQAGFSQLKMADTWSLQNNGRYYATANDSALIAFTLGSSPLETTGIRMVGAHTDSPCLKVKPLADKHSDTYLQVGVEVYGGALLNPWFDRDLSLAGRVQYRTQQKQCSALIDFKHPIASIPSLAIHLDREANKNRSINPQKHLSPLILQHNKNTKMTFSDLLLSQLKQQHPELDPQEILTYDISLYDTQPATLTGFNQEFIASARLDNLVSCYTGLMSILESPQQPSLLVCNDHEEVGSVSTSGAQGPLLQSVLERLSHSTESYQRMIASSVLISADNAHATHPNYADKHDAQHLIHINQGPVIKYNASQRYASNDETAALFIHLCNEQHIPYQQFVMRSDMGCGSTIGPMTSAAIGVRTLDIGIPSLAMHSVREMMGNQDAFWLFSVLKAFYQRTPTS